jgi:phospholipase C
MMARSERTRAVGCVLLLVGVLVGVVGAAGTAGAAARRTAPPAPIQHVIVVIQSGHSFDNYFGTRPGVDGIPAGVCEPVAAKSRTCVRPYHLKSGQARAALSLTGGITKSAIDGGRMDGFVSAQPNASTGSVAMGYFDRSDLPFYWSLADRFTLFDHFYAASQGGALPNRIAAIAGQDAGVTKNTAPPTGIDVPTVFDQLDRAGLSWKFYVQNSVGPTATGTKSTDPLLAFPRLMQSKADSSRIVSSSDYFTDLIHGSLPAVSFVTTTAESERSPQSPALGESFVKSIVDALMQSPDWDHSALLLTYDDAGGWYDNVVPPVVGGQQLGLRVPAILVSPYARAGAVDSEQTDTAAIPAFVDQVFHLPLLSAQAAAAGSLMTGLETRAHPGAAVIEPSPAPVVARHSVLVVYVLYLGALLGMIALIILAFRRPHWWPFDFLDRQPPHGVGP